jgi:signal transduction histidine kinase
VAVAAAVAIVGSPILRMSNGIGTFLAVLSAIGWGGAVAIGLTLRNMAILRSATEEEVRSAERMELARELHDVVAHHVTGIVVQAQAARVVIPHQPAVINEALIAIERAGEDALSAMRRMVGVLRDQAALRAGDDTSRNPGTALVDITDLAQRFDANSGLVTLRLSDEAATLAAPPGVAMTAYRVVQEALTNVRRHAPEANWVWIELAVDPAVEGHQLTPGPDHTWVITARLPLTAKRGWT